VRVFDGVIFIYSLTARLDNTVGEVRSGRGEGCRGLHMLGARGRTDCRDLSFLIFLLHPTPMEFLSGASYRSLTILVY
jgi:hypothetical protein